MGKALPAIEAAMGDAWWNEEPIMVTSFVLEGTNVSWHATSAEVAATASSSSPPPAVASAQVAPVGVFVSPTGSDTAPGTFDQPLRTLPAAARLGAGRTVWLRGNAGPFRVHNATEALALTAAHNDTTFTCFDPKCIVSGSAELPALGAWKQSVDARLPATAVGHVLELELREALPQAVSRLGKVSEAGTHATLRLGATPLWLARWPNLDAVNTLTPQWTRTVMFPKPPADCGGHHGSEACVVVGGEVAVRAQQRWTGAAARGELTLKGFWRYFWRDDVAPAVTVAPYLVNGSAAVLLSRRDGKPMGIYGAPPNASYFFALNVLEELDMPGEYYIDREEGKVFLFPPDGSAADDRPELSLMTSPFVSANGAGSVTINGVSFEGARGDAATVSGGASVVFSNASFSHFGGSAVVVSGGSSHAIRRSSMRYLGSQAVSITGGDRPSLTRGDHVVEDCVITDFGRWLSAYKPAVRVEGVGNTVRRTEMANGWQQALLFGGNDHVFENNWIHHVALEIYDGAAVYAGRDFTMRGNVVRSNLFQAIGRPGGWVGGCGPQL